jgi:ABC-type glutathione transport system ATPase component
VRLDGNELLGAAPETFALPSVVHVALALQNTPFNPASTVGAQIAEPLRERLRMSKSEASQRAAELAEECWCGTPISCPAASDGGRH